jgi:chaperonin GroEL
VEVNEKKDLFQDALHATRAAVESGIVPGGGAALLHASKKLSQLHGANQDQDVGIKIVALAVRIPCRTIANNAGEEGAVVVQTLLDKKDPIIGFNAATAKYVDMMAAGIIDPAKVVRMALLDASSVASLMITTEAMIVTHEEKSPSAVHD